MRRRGFTIIEIVVVVTVIAILSSIVILSVVRYQQFARDSQRTAKVTVLAEALEKYYDRTGEYPSCSAISNSDVGTITKAVLPGVDRAAFLTPKSTSDVTNSIICSALTLETDAFAYIGDGSAACLSGAACLNWRIEYLGEQNNEILSVSSRRNTVIATSGVSVITAIAMSSSEVNTAWTAVDNSIGYTLQYSTDNTFLTNLNERELSGTSSAITELSPATQYFFRVRPRANESVGNWSNIASATTLNNYGSLAVASSVEGYWTNAPEGFLIENGQAVSRETYADLFAVIGTTYGVGDGSTTFNVPDSRGRTSVTQNASDVEFATVGQKTGSKTEVLTIAQLPSHTHIQNAHSHSISDPGHNHSQNLHSHTQNVGAPIGSGGGIRRDYNGDGTSASYQHGTPTDNAWPTNNPSATGVTIAAASATNQSTGGGAGHNNIQPSIVKSAAIKYTLPDEGADSYPAGSTIQGYWTTAPEGYALEDGAAVSRSAYSDLFAAIGTTYGAGNGSTTFNLPDSRGYAAVNLNTSESEFNAMGKKVGAKTEVLSIAEMPIHTHVQNAHTHAVSDPGHNHTQNPHSHGQEVSANSGGGALRIDWNSDGPTGSYAQGVSVGSAAGTNNPSLTGVTMGAATATNQNTGGGGSHNEIQPSIVKQSAIKLTPAVADSATKIAPGTSVSGWWSAAPSGYLVENGAAVSRATYASLFAVIGTTYGSGDGSTTFNLPDSRGRVGVSRNASDVEFDTMGKKYGTKVETLTIAQIPSHTHVQNAHSHGVSDPGHNHTQNGHTHPQIVTAPTGGGSGIRFDYDADGNGLYYSQGITTGTTTATNNPSTTGISVVSATAVNQSTGSGQAHDNLQPTITKLFVIKF